MDSMTDLEVAASEAVRIMPDHDADAIGRVDAVIRKLTDYRRMLMSELAGPTTGKSYRIAEERYAERSYNTRRLREDFNEAGWTLDDLIESDVVRLSWQWSKMRNLAMNADIGLRIAGHEITEEEAEHVGENWKSRYKLETI